MHFRPLFGKQMSDLPLPTSDRRNGFPGFAVKASAITGSRVLNLKGEDIGNVEGVVIDVISGRVAYLVLSFGGFLGMGERHYAVPWKRLKFDVRANVYILDASREQIENAPGFEKENESQLADEEWNRRLHDYFETLPIWNI